jgi:hypothetical protein
VEPTSHRRVKKEKGTVQASILSSFDFVVDVFTLPMGALETSAAALPGLVNAPYGSARLERAEIAVAFAANMLSGCTRRSSERCGDLQHLLEKRVPDDQYALDDQRG